MRPLSHNTWDFCVGTGTYTCCERGLISHGTSRQHIFFPFMGEENVNIIENKKVVVN